MAKRIRSGLKHLRKSIKRSAANTAAKSRARTLVRAAAASGAREKVAEAQAALDKAVARGAIHPNAAARRKSRLMRRAAARQP